MRLDILIRKKFFLILFIIFFFDTNVVIAGCNILKNHTIKNLDYIDVSFDDKKKWYKNLGNLLLQKIGKREWDTENNKKKFKGTVNFHFKNKDKCSELAKIRFHGDGRDHIDFFNGFPISSMNVKLTSGNFNNIVNFLLLLPETRNSDNEIFNISFLKHFNILAPETYYIKLKFDNKYSKFIFQEKIRKEFLEKEKFVEGPIFGGHENFSRYNEFARVSRLLNSSWIKKNTDKLKLSFDLIEFVNLLFLKDPKLNQKKKLHDFSSLIFDFDLFYDNEKERFYEFETMMYILTSYHGLRGDQRRLYYHPIIDEFFPIYYDGESTILNRNPLDFYEDLSTNHLRNEYDKTHEPIPTYASTQGVKIVREKLKLLELDKLQSDLNDRGLKINKKKLNKILSKIHKRLERLENAEIPKPNLKLNKSVYAGYVNDRDILIFKESSNKQIGQKFIFCNFSLEECYESFLNYNEQVKLLKQNYKNNGIKEHQYISQKIVEYKNVTMSREKKGIKKYFKNIVNKDFLIYHNEFIEIKVDNEDKAIDIFQTSPSGRAVIVDTLIEDWKINFVGSKKFNTTSSNYRVVDNLTGCVTIINSSIKKLKFKAENIICEDSLNIVNSEGSIETVEIKQSFYDALDADFSNLEFSNIIIENANNDCIDFSFGQYKIKNSIVKECGDKGISIGEKSTLSLDAIEIQKSNIGIAAKDNSKVNINLANMDEVKICLSAYKKKQEFGPSFLKVKKMICTNSIVEIEKDLGSEIKFN